MPLVKRTIEPYYASRCRVPEKVENELECIVSHTLANVIRQLSSLSKHADNLFSEICNEAVSLLERSSALQNRVQQLAVRVTKLDPVGEEGKKNAMLVIGCAPVSKSVWPVRFFRPFEHDFVWLMACHLLKVG